MEGGRKPVGCGVPVGVGAALGVPVGVLVALMGARPVGRVRDGRGLPGFAALAVGALAGAEPGVPAGVPAPDDGSALCTPRMMVSTWPGSLP